MIKNQIYQLGTGTSWDGFTHRNNLYTAFQDTPEVYLDTIEKIMDVNLGEDFVSMVEKHATEYLPAGSDGKYVWKLDYMPHSNYECVGAYLDADGAVEITNTHRPGANYTSFYMDFEGDVFQDTETIAGMNPDNDRLFVVRRWNVFGNTFRYQMQLANSRSEDSFIDYTSVLPGTVWSEEAGLVSKYLSDKGVDISFRTPVQASNELSSFRLQHTIAGHMVDYRPKYFFYNDKNGKRVDKPLWISTVEYEFLAKIRRMRANLVMHGRSNRNPKTGFVGLTSEAGYEIVAGSGWKEQMLSSNRHYYTGQPNLKELIDIILDTVVGTISFGARKAIVYAGEFGLKELSDMVTRAYGSGAYTQNKPWMQDTTGRAFKWDSGNGIFAKSGQIMGVADVNGIELTFMLDASKDDATRNKMMMPGKPGFVSSYQYDIVGLGGKDADSNMKIMRIAGQEPTFAVKEGMRGMFKGGKSFTSPKQVATAVDGTTIHYQDFGIGAKVSDPTKVICYYPDVLPYN